MKYLNAGLAFAAGLVPLLDRFPKAKAVAVPDVVDDMKAQLAPEWLDGFWRKRFPGEIAERLVAAEPLEGELTLGGRKLVVIDMGWSDTARSTALHVPSLDLIVAGDTVYNGVHPYEAMRALHPDRANPGSLWSGSNAAKGQGS